MLQDCLGNPINCDSDSPLPQCVWMSRRGKKGVRAATTRASGLERQRVCRHGEETPVKGIQLIFHVIVNNAEDSICPPQSRNPTLKTSACPGGQRTSKFKRRWSCSSNMNACYALSLSLESLVTNSEPSKSKLSVFTPPLVCGSFLLLITWFSLFLLTNLFRLV